MHVILFLYENAINFYFVAVMTPVSRVDCFVLKINLTALMWISSRSWSDFGDPHRAIEYVTLYVAYWEKILHHNGQLRNGIF